MVTVNELTILCPAMVFVIAENGGGIHRELCLQPKAYRKGIECNLALSYKGPCLLLFGCLG